MAPTTRTRRAEIHAHADARTDLELLAQLHDQLEFGQVLDHRNDGAAQLGGQRGELDVAGFLEAVADDQALGRVAGHAQHRQQLGLAAHLQAEAQRRTVLADLLHHAALLVHLHGEHADVFALVVVLLDGGVERLVHVEQAALQQVAEVHQHGGAQATLTQALHHFHQVDLGAGHLARAHHNVALGVGVEEALAPQTDVVQIDRVLNGPARFEPGHASPRARGCRWNGRRVGDGRNGVLCQLGCAPGCANARGANW